MRFVLEHGVCCFSDCFDVITSFTICSIGMFLLLGLGLKVIPSDFHKYVNEKFVRM